MSQVPSYLLRGRIVTMRDENAVIPAGYVLVKDGRIQGVYTHQQDIPLDQQQAPVIDTGGSIYPGLIDLHNHFVYNVLPLWVVPKLYENRSQWPSHPDYRAGVSKPIKEALAKYSLSAKALVRYVEAKALLGGTTTGQGMRTRVHGGSKLFVGAMRNVEEPLNAHLLPAGSRVPDLYMGGETEQERIDSFRAALHRPLQGAYFYHLSEGVDNNARQHFFNLKDHNLINEKLVGIHSLGLDSDDILYLAQRGAKVVWSPFSNQLLYGTTLDLHALKASGITFSIGCDWSPTGSKNLLQELKAAAHANSVQDTPFSHFQLVQAVTSSAARVAAWDDQLGTIEVGKLADLVVIKDRHQDPYTNLILATEAEVDLVIVDGITRFGSRGPMESLHAGNGALLEHLELSGKARCFFLHAESSEINDVSFTQAMETLRHAMADLPAFLDRMSQEQPALLDGQEAVPEFMIELDNEFHFHEDVLREDVEPTEPGLFADVPMAHFVELDTPTVAGSDYWKRIDSQVNIDPSLKAWFKECYHLNGQE